MPIIDGKINKTKDQLYQDAKSSSPDIVGEPFKDYVNNQITQRQKVHGSGFGSTRSQKDLVYLNSRNAWVKMASSVQIGGNFDDFFRNNPNEIGFTEEFVNFDKEAEAKLKRLGLNVKNYQGIKLAQEGVLFNGITDNKTKIPKKGVSPFSSKINNSVYGFGGTGFGLQPMPGITSFNIGHNNIGSIRTAQIEIKAYNDFQFDLISILYIRLGFTMLIEWGNSMYLDNKGNLTKMGPTIIDNNQTGWFGQKGTSHLEMFNQIETKREQYNGNYDGFFGKVTNFDYSFETDGSYSITLDLVSMGDVIESFNLNTLNDEDIALDLTGTPYSNNRILNNNSILNKFYCLKNTIQIGPDGKRIVLTDELKSFLPGNEGIQSYDNQDYIIVAGRNQQDFKGGLLQPGELRYNYQYITFYYFLNLIQELVTHLGNKSSHFPQLIVNTSAQNYCKNIPRLASFNPNMCVINNNFNTPAFSAFKRFDFRAFSSTSDNEVELVSNPFLGDIMHIYLNLDYLENLIQTKTKTTGELLLFDLLNTICQDVNNSLANVTQLKPTLQDDSIIVIRDFNLDVKTGEDGKIIDKNSTPLEIYGVNTSDKNQSNFVKDFSFNTTISKALANMMSIGATANAQGIDSYAGFFKNLNKGLVDRFKEYSLESDPNFTLDCGVKKSEEKPKNQKVTLKEFYKKDFRGQVDDLLNFRIKGYQIVVDQIKKAYEKTPILIDSYRTWVRETVYSTKEITNTSETEGYLAKAWAAFTSTPGYTGEIFNYFDPAYGFWEQGKSLFSNLLKHYTNLREPGVDSLVGFIPMDVELTLEGISGIKIYNQLVINTSHLPSGYPDNIELVVIGVDHQLADNEWTTRIRTITKPSSKNLRPLSNPVLEIERTDGVGEPDLNPLGSPLLNMDGWPPSSVNNMIPIFAPIERNPDVGYTSGPQAGRKLKGKLAKDHNGVDFGAPQGLKVYAVTGGIVKKGPPNPGGWGNDFVYIEEKRTVNLPDRSTFETLFHIYGHLDTYKEELIGTYIEPGTIIGTIGNKGSEDTGYHLHYEVRKGTYSKNSRNFKGWKNPILELNNAYNPSTFPNAQIITPDRNKTLFNLPSLK